MQFIEPKIIAGKKVNWVVSNHTRSIVKVYAEYTGCNEDEIVDRFLKNILEDEKFIDWIKQKRRNKRIIEQLRLSEEWINGETKKVSS